MLRLAVHQFPSPLHHVHQRLAHNNHFRIGAPKWGKNIASNAGIISCDERELGTNLEDIYGGGTGREICTYRSTHFKHYFCALLTGK